jgi:hypothetical protein
MEISPNSISESLGIPSQSSPQYQAAINQNQNTMTMKDEAIISMLGQRMQAAMGGK